jgi:hypothetical protein
MAEKTFNTILPVLAGWVGTVLAYYFSAQSLERTSNTLEKAMDQAAGGADSAVIVSQKMIPAMSIRELQDLSKTKPEDLRLRELQKLFEAPSGGTPRITRMVFVDNGVFRYLMHGSVLNAFLLNNPSGEPTLADMLRDADVLRQISKLVVFVKASATLAQARDAMNAVPGAQDIIVTGSGNASEPMLGWLTNVDLTKTLST